MSVPELRPASGRSHRLLSVPRSADHHATWGHWRTRLARLRDITRHLSANPLSITDVEGAMTGIPQVTRLDTRVAACILGVPDEERTADPLPGRQRLAGALG